MNIKRRRQIKKLITQLDDIQQAITELQNEEEEARDNLPESLIDSDRYYSMDEAVNALEYAAGSIESEVLHYLEEAMN